MLKRKKRSFSISKSALIALRAVVVDVAVTEARAEPVAVVVAAAVGDVVAPSPLMTSPLSLLSRRQMLQTTLDECSLVPFFGHFTGYGLVCQSQPTQFEQCVPCCSVV